MANTYSQITIHIVFAVKYRECLIHPSWREQLHKYISGIIKNEGGRSLSVGGWLDHVHILTELPLTKSISDFVRIIKANSSKWVNEQRFIQGIFRWQEGYGAFSHSIDQRSRLINYIMNQEEHHRKKTFKDEYLNVLEKFEIEYDNEYLFDFLGDNDE